MFFYLSTGTRAETWIDTCVGEETEVICPGIENNEFENLALYVKDPKYPKLRPQRIYYCTQTECTTYPLRKRYAQRIKTRKPVERKMFVTQMRKDDLLTYICQVEFKGNRKAPEYQINVSSSVKCKWIDL